MQQETAPVGAVPLSRKASLRPGPLQYRFRPGHGPRPENRRRPEGNPAGHEGIGYRRRCSLAQQHGLSRQHQPGCQIPRGRLPKCFL